MDSSDFNWFKGGSREPSLSPQSFYPPVVTLIRNILYTQISLLNLSFHFVFCKCWVFEVGVAPWRSSGVPVRGVELPGDDLLAGVVGTEPLTGTELLTGTEPLVPSLPTCSSSWPCASNSSCAFCTQKATHCCILYFSRNGQKSATVMPGILLLVSTASCRLQLSSMTQLSPTFTVM